MIHHVALRTADVENLARFYREWFQLAVVRDARPRSVWLARDTADSVLMIEAQTPTEPPLARGSLELTAFRVTVRERLRLREKLLRAGMLEAETEHTLYFRDPDGRRVAASSYPLGTRRWRSLRPAWLSRFSQRFA